MQVYGRVVNPQTRPAHMQQKSLFLCIFSHSIYTRIHVTHQGAASVECEITNYICIDFLSCYKNRRLPLTRAPKLDQFNIPLHLVQQPDMQLFWMTFKVGKTQSMVFISILSETLPHDHGCQSPLLSDELLAATFVKDGAHYLRGWYFPHPKYEKSIIKSNGHKAQVRDRIMEIIPSRWRRCLYSNTRVSLWLPWQQTAEHLKRAGDLIRSTYCWYYSSMAMSVRNIKCPSSV